MKGVNMFRKEKHPGAKGRLELMRLWKRTKKQTLVFLAKEAKDPKVQKKAWDLLIKRGELGCGDLYEFMEDSNEEIWDLFLRLGATPEDLVDVIKYEEEFYKQKAWNELKRKIKKSEIKKARKIRLLMFIVEEVHDLREEAWSILKKLEPSVEKLKYLLDLPCMRYLPDLSQEIQRGIRKRKERDRQGDRFARKIELLESKKRE